MTEDFHSFEDYSNILKPISSKVIKGKLFVFEGCSNNNLISEGSFTRMLNVLKTKSFAILSAHRAYFSKQENIQRNRKLRDIFNKKKMGVYQLVGHWTEAPRNKDDIAKQTSISEAEVYGYFQGRLITYSKFKREEHL